MTTEEPDLTGLVLDGRYELVRRLGVGGMGSVYEARHVRIAKSVAVKVLHREFAYKESFRRRFLREAQAASLIRHKNVVAIHDFGDHEDVAYIVMDLLEGRDLHALVHERAPLPWAQARGILLQVAAALGAAHDCGVFHRDVKPANVFVSDDPHDGVVVKVLDFGIARASTMETTQPTDEAATGSSRVFGTPTYMAPEIAFGEPADGRADLYSLGVVAYRMLTGQLPFDGDVPYLVISRHANEPPAALRSLEPSIPRGVEQVVLKALAKRPGDRFQSMASFARALAAIDEAGHGEVPAALLLETDAAVAGPRTESVPRASRAQRAGRAAVTPASEAEPRDEAPRRGASESSDGGTPRTDLGTERLPSRRRVTGVSDVVSVGRTGFTERVDGDDDEDDEPLARPSRELVARADVDPVAVPPTSPPTRNWGGLVRMLGLLGLVALAAAVGALVARQQGPAAPTPDAVVTRDAEPTEPVAGVEAQPRAPAAAGAVAAEAGPAPAGASNGDVGLAAADDTGASTTSEPPAADTDATTTSEPPPDDATTGDPGARSSTPSRPSTRRPTDARVKKKLARELQRACGAGSAGYRVTIEGIITAEGRVTGVRVLDAGDARGCIERLVEAQRFPTGELRTLDLSLTL